MNELELRRYIDRNISEVKRTISVKASSGKVEWTSINGRPEMNRYLLKSEASVTYLTARAAALAYLSRGTGSSDGMTRAELAASYYVKDDDWSLAQHNNWAGAYADTSLADAFSTELEPYLKSEDAEDIYLTITDAADTYYTRVEQETWAGDYADSSLASAFNTELEPYLLSETAEDTYLTITDAASTYLPSATAAETYLTISAATSTYLTQQEATETYRTIADSSVSVIAPNYGKLATVTIGNETAEIGLQYHEGQAEISLSGTTVTLSLSDYSSENNYVAIGLGGKICYAAAESHTHDYTDDITGKPHIPTVELNSGEASSILTVDGSGVTIINASTVNSRLSSVETNIGTASAVLQAIINGGTV